VSTLPSPEIDGLLVVNKPTGPTSHDIVARARRALGTRRIGHTGTLDPAASGVLPLVVGRATRLAQFLTASDKEYVATIRFGRTSDTYDAAGTVTSETGAVPDRAALADALARCTGTFEQTPPAYSAKKIDGVRSYALARDRAPVTPRPVKVTAHRLELVEWSPPLAVVRLACSAGFYVRSLAHDLGQELGTGALLEALVRTRSGAFTQATAVPLDAVTPERRDELRAALVPMEALLTDIASVTLSPEGVRRVRQGQDAGPAHMLGSPAGTAPLVRLLGPDGRLVGLAAPAATPGFLHASVVLS
jgi:tRNA pseudouridine55 synthase